MREDITNTGDLRLGDGGSNYTQISATGVQSFSGTGKIQMISGWEDILPVTLKDDANGGWAWTTVTNSNRKAFSASSTTQAKELPGKFHVPHGITLNQADSQIHVHWEAANQAAGNVILTAYITAALRDGTWTTDYAHVFTLTPSSYAANTHVVTELELNANIVAKIVPDSMVDVRLVRDRGTNATDTYNDIIWLHTMDIHSRHDGRPTTASSVGAGWVKA